ncbi:hypothetical protein TNCV_95651 [Trichonephila clavipes]|nr:hypothetical protein TNCV_95651 [Trichonephila clavipes]
MGRRLASRAICPATIMSWWQTHALHYFCQVIGSIPDASKDPPFTGCSRILGENFKGRSVSLNALVKTTTSRRTKTFPNTDSCSNLNPCDVSYLSLKFVPMILGHPNREADIPQICPDSVIILTMCGGLRVDCQLISTSSTNRVSKL